MLSSTIIYLSKPAKCSYESISIHTIQDSTAQLSIMLTHLSLYYHVLINLSNCTSANCLLWICLLKLCKMLEEWFFGLSQISHRLPPVQYSYYMGFSKPDGSEQFLLWCVFIIIFIGRFIISPSSDLFVSVCEFIFHYNDWK